MSHELTIARNGEAEMAYTVDGGTPWHRLGQRIVRGAPLEEWMAAAHMDFHVEKARLFDDTGRPTPVYQIRRADNGAHFAAVTDRYQVVQNVDQFRALEPLVESGHLSYETCGTLRGGAVQWVLGRIDKDIRVRGELVQGYVMVSNSHDGSRALRFDLTPVRVVCNNTLTLSDTRGMELTRIRHEGDIQSKIAEAMAVFERTVEAFVGFEQLMNELADMRLDPAQAEALTHRLLLPRHGKLEDELSPTRTEQAQSINRLFVEGKGNRGESRWDWLNGVVEFTDHVYEGGGGDQINSLMRGRACGLKRKAMAIATNGRAKQLVAVGVED